MSTITCKLFGVPQILKDGQPVFLPYSKINALLYYVLVSKVVSREELAGLLWPDEMDETARRNLRNAIYQAKKALGTNLILSPKKSLLMLNENLDLTLDVDQFLQAPQENLRLYTGEFLQGFFLKGAETYEYWIVKMRNYFKEKFFSECYQKVADDLDARRYDSVETHIRYLMELDEYDERAFRLLLRFYQETGRNGKVIESYYEFASCCAGSWALLRIRRPRKFMSAPWRKCILRRGVPLPTTSPFSSAAIRRSPPWTRR